MRARSLPNTVISPRVGFSDMNSSRSSVVLPAPDGPLRNWKERSRNLEGDVAEDFRTHPVAQADIFEADQRSTTLRFAAHACGRSSRRPSARMVNRRLISRPDQAPRWRSINHFGLPRNGHGSKGWSAGMADERKPRPVSGEIMTDAPAVGRRAMRGRTPTSSTPTTRPSRAAAAATHPPQPHARRPPRRSRAWTCCARRKRRRPAGRARRAALLDRRHRRSPLAAFWVSGGHALVRDAPLPSRKRRRRRCSIAGVTSRVDDVRRAAGAVRRRRGRQ